MTDELLYTFLELQLPHGLFSHYPDIYGEERLLTILDGFPSVFEKRLHSR
jgi:hypothetical protein